MTQRRIVVSHFVTDIRAGVRDSDLMKKYNISFQELKSAFSKLVKKGLLDSRELAGRLGKAAIVRKPKRRAIARIRAQDFVEDVQLGLDDANLMFKYHLTPRQLERVFGKLVETGIFTETQLYDRSVAADTLTTSVMMQAQTAMEELNEDIGS
jgi:uncharacterized protein (DUF433 family)